MLSLFFLIVKYEQYQYQYQYQDYRFAINLLLCTIDSASHTDTPLLRHKLSVVLYVKVYRVYRNLPIEVYYTVL